MRRRTVLYILLVLCLCLNMGVAVSGADQSSKSTNKFEPGKLLDAGTAVTLESGDLKLEVNTGSGNISLNDSQSGYVWKSNALKADDDWIAYGVNKSRVASQVIVSYLDENVLLETKSFAESLQAGSSRIEAYAANDTVTLCYIFGDLGFTIPVQYSLHDRQLLVQVPFSGIKETGTARLVSLSILPFFGAGTTEEEGFLFLPDGSGTIIDFNNGKNSEGALTLDALYGDRSKVTDKRQPETQPVLFPCFGISHKLDGKNASLLAYVTEGAWSGQISSNVSGQETSYNYAYYTFLYREYGLDKLLDRTWASKTKLVINDTPVDEERFAISYTFTDPAQSGLSGMAEACRKLLFPNQHASASAAVPVFLDVAMGVRVKQNFLGIPYETLRTLTTFDQAKSIAGEFRQAGASSAIMRLQGFDSDGIMHGKLDAELRVSGKVGGLAGLKTLQDTDGVEAYPEVNPISFNRSSWRAMPYFHTALNVLSEAIRRPEYTLASKVKNNNIKADYLVKAGYLPKVIKSLSSSLDKNSIRNVSPSSIGYAPYGDHSRSSSIGIAKTADLLEDAAKQLRSRGGLMLEAPVASLIPYTSSIIHLPEDSSHYSMTNRSVPFAQMVLSGLVPYSGRDINRDGNTRQAMLQSIATGSALSFELMWAEYDTIRGTDAQGYYSACYNDNKNALQTLYKESRQALGPVYGYRMTDYYVTSKGLSVSIYENGYAILVNQTRQPINWNGHTIQSYGWQSVLTQEG